jgi:hypothetical protein
MRYWRSHHRRLVAVNRCRLDSTGPPRRVDWGRRADPARGRGLPLPVLAARLQFSEVVDGRNANTTDGVRLALGRETRDFADFTPDAAAIGVWDPTLMAP